MGLKLSKELSSGVWKTGIFKFDHFSGRKKYESRKPHGTGFKVQKLQNVKMGPPFLFEKKRKKSISGIERGLFIFLNFVISFSVLEVS